MVSSRLAFDSFRYRSVCLKSAWPSMSWIVRMSGRSRLLREAQLPTERVGAWVSAEADLGVVEMRRSPAGVKRRQPFESFQCAIRVAQQSEDLGLPLRQVGELRGDRFGLSAPAVDRVDIASHAGTANRESLEAVERFGALTLEEQRPA